MQRRPILLASAAIALFLIYCVSLLKIPNEEEPAPGWSLPLQAPNDNGVDSELAITPGIEEVKEPAPATEPLPLGMNAPRCLSA